MVELNERMATVETKIDNLNGKMDDFIKSADKKFAPRWITTVLAWGAGILGTIIAGVSITLVVRGF